MNLHNRIVYVELHQDDIGSATHHFSGDNSMGAGHENFLAYVISSGVLAYILKAVLTAFSTARNNFQTLVHVAKCIKREILMNNLNMEEFIETIPGVEAKMKNDSNYKPFMVSNDKSAEVVTALLDSMLKLPVDTVDSIVEFYRYDYEVNLVMDKILSQDFSELSLQRKTEVMGNFKTCLASTKISGDYALLQLEEFLEETKRGFTNSALKNTGAKLKNHWLNLSEVLKSLWKKRA